MPSYAVRARRAIGVLLVFIWTGSAFLFPLTVQAEEYGRVVISEIRISGGSGKSTDEYVELYNPSEVGMDISGWQLAKLTKSAESGEYVYLIEGFPEGTVIEPRRYLLIAHEDYTVSNGVEPDLVYTDASLADNNTLVLNSHSGEIIDLVGWGEAGHVETEAAPPPTVGLPSLERKPGGSLGNGEDTDDNSRDFVRALSSPQNSLNMVEPESGGSFGVTSTTVPLTSLEIPGEGFSVFVIVETEAGVVTTTDHDQIIDPETDSAEGSGEVSLPVETTTTTVPEVVTSTPPVMVSSSAPFLLGPTTTGKILLNELMVHPSEGGREWIELYNPTPSSVLLAGWRIYDAVGEIAAPTSTIGPEGYLVVYLPASRLNNAGDEVVLKDARGHVRDRISYGAESDGIPIPNQGEVLVRQPHNVDEAATNWYRSTAPTPGFTNILTAPSETPANSVQPPVAPIHTLAPAPAATTTPTAIPVATSSIGGSLDLELARRVILSEAFLNPVGPDDGEYIELYNPTALDIDLSRFYLDDAEGGSAPYRFPEGTVLTSGEYRMWGRQITGISLNNTADTVRLLFPDATVVNQWPVSDVKEGLSYAFNGDAGFVWTRIITPGVANQILENITYQPEVQRADQIPQPVTRETGQTTAPKTSAPKAAPKASGRVSKKTVAKTKQAARKFVKPARAVALQELGGLTLGERIKVAGVVSVRPGSFGSGLWYIQDHSATSSPAGVQVYLGKKPVPDLKIGDRIEVVGELTESQGERRIKIGAPADIRVLASGLHLESRRLDLSVVPAGLLGTLVALDGEVTDVKSQYLYLDNGSGEIKVTIKSGTGIGKPDFVEGQILFAQGILARDGGDYHILPRSLEDFRRVKTAIAVSTSTPDNVVRSTRRSWLMGGIASLLFGFMARSRVISLVSAARRIAVAILGFLIKK